jgi:hypothetical protein
MKEEWERLEQREEKIRTHFHEQHQLVIGALPPPIVQSHHDNDNHYYVLMI